MIVDNLLVGLLIEGKLALDGRFHSRWILWQVDFRGTAEGFGLRDHARSIQHHHVSRIGVGSAQASMMCMIYHHFSWPRFERVMNQ